MKYINLSAQKMAPVSDAAMERARRAVAKVAYSKTALQKMVAMGNAAPNARIMAGCTNKADAGVSHSVALSI